MIQETRTADVRSTIDGDKIALSIEQESMGHIMALLTNLYADPELAVLREYSTNARDTHVAAGVKRPIEVTLPGHLSPFLKIKDYGEGMSVEDIHNIYSKYGASTRRDSNDAAGGFGLGCKSALAYADQFTLTSCKDGTKIVVTIGRDEDGSGSMTVADTLQCDEGNGTEILIPAKQANDFARKAQVFFSYWQPGTVLVNGQQPARFDGLQVTDSIWLVKQGDRYSNPVSKLVMGNVAYPIPPKYAAAWDLPRGTALVAYVGIGEATLPPNRESLMETPRTNATCQAVGVAYKQGIKDAVQRKVNAAQNASEAVEMVVEWQQYVGGESFRWRGHDLPTAYEPPVGGQGILVTEAQSYRAAGRAGYIKSIALASWPATVWVEDFSPSKHTAAHKRKLLKWAEDAGISARQFALFPGKVKRSIFMDDSRIVSWETSIKPIKIEHTKTLGYGSRPARLSGSYDCFIGDVENREVPANDLDTKRPLFFRNGNMRESRWYASLLQEHYPGCTLVCLPANRIAKFQRDFPKAKQASEGVSNAKQRWEASITPREKAALALYDSRYNGYESPYENLRELDQDKIVDPDLQQEIRHAKVDVVKLVKQRQQFGQRAGSTRYAGALTKYPLFTSRRGLSAEGQNHLYLYLNAAYVAENRSDA